jgi:hypothetical protein
LRVSFRCLRRTPSRRIAKQPSGRIAIVWARVALGLAGGNLSGGSGGLIRVAAAIWAGHC